MHGGNDQIVSRMIDQLPAGSVKYGNKLVAVNMTGVFLGTKLAAQALREAAKSSEHGSAIVNLASIAGIVGSQLDPPRHHPDGHGPADFRRACTAHRYQ